jgi:antitoxin component YwqK of YwqJK toxin-antitoxin module
VLSLVFSLLFFHSFSQKQVTYFYPDSTISSTGMLKNGRPDGIWKTYFPDGKLKSEGKWYKGLLDSTWNFYFHTGQIKLKIQYNKGIKNGYSYTYKISKDSIHYMFKKELFLDGNIEGKVFTFYQNGNVKSVTNYNRDFKTGEEIEFDKEGKPETILFYENNRLISSERINQINNGAKNGTWIKLDQDFNIINKDILSNDSIIKTDKINQELKIKYTIEGLEETIKDTTFSGQYLNGIPVGRHLQFDSLNQPVSYIIYDSSGIKKEEGLIKNYKLNGYVIGYYNDANIKYKGSYLNNQKHGHWKFYFQNGNIEQKGSFQKGLLHGDWLWYYKNGDTLRLETYRFGKRNDLYISYDPYGNIVQKGYYDNDLKQGIWSENTGEFLLKGKYFDDNKDGKWCGVYHNGEKAYIGSYLRGKPIGKHIFYYKTGTKRKIEFYDSGRKTGHWQYYNTEGQLYKIVSYQKGENIYIKE